MNLTGVTSGGVSSRSLQELRAKLNTLAANDIVQDERLSVLEEISAQHETDLNAIGTRTDTLENMVDSLAATSQGGALYIDGLLEDVADLKTDVASLMSSSSGGAVYIDGLLDEVATLKTNTTQLNTAIAQHWSAIVAEGEARVSMFDMTTNTVNNLREELTYNYTTSDTTLDQKIDNVQNNVTTLSATTSALQGQVISLQNRVNTLEAAVSTILQGSGSATVTQADILNLQTQIANLGTRIGGVEAGQTSLSDSVVVLNTNNTTTTNNLRDIFKGIRSGFIQTGDISGTLATQSLPYGGCILSATRVNNGISSIMTVDFTYTDMGFIPSLQTTLMDSNIGAGSFITVQPATITATSARVYLKEN